MPKYEPGRGRSSDGRPGSGASKGASKGRPSAGAKGSSKGGPKGDARGGAPRALHSRGARAGRPAEAPVRDARRQGARLRVDPPPVAHRQGSRRPVARHLVARGSSGRSSSGRSSTGRAPGKPEGGSRASSGRKPGPPHACRARARCERAGRDGRRVVPGGPSAPAARVAAPKAGSGPTARTPTTRPRDAAHGRRRPRAPIGVDGVIAPAGPIVLVATVPIDRIADRGDRPDRPTTWW